MFINYSVFSTEISFDPLYCIANLIDIWPTILNYLFKIVFFFFCNSILSSQLKIIFLSIILHCLLKFLLPSKLYLTYYFVLRTEDYFRLLYCLLNYIQLVKLHCLFKFVFVLIYCVAYWKLYFCLVWCNACWKYITLLYCIELLHILPFKMCCLLYCIECIIFEEIGITWCNEYEGQISHYLLAKLVIYN